jgi:glutamine amidotransferase
MPSDEITVIDYGVGNLLSVQRALERCGARVLVSSDPETILKSPKVVFPGVGAFPSAMKKLEELSLVSVIQEIAKLGKPLLAICLGMQLLFDESEEFGNTKGLGIIPGKVVSMRDATTHSQLSKFPHIGWSPLQFVDASDSWSNTLLDGIKEGDSTYFVHSFMAIPKFEEHRISDVNYSGLRIPAVVAKGKITGCQFHPEKSGEVGLQIIRNFTKA